VVDGERVIGTHATGTVPAMPFGPPIDDDGLVGVDRIRADRFTEYQREGLGYLHLQTTRPQTVSYALTDSPVALLAWITEKFREWTDPAAELPEDAVDIDHLLTLVTVSWFTRAGASMAHATYEGMQAFRQMAAHGGSGDADPDGRPGPPAGVAVFAADNTIRSVMDPQGRISHWSEFDRGGHFAAMETPGLLVGDVRKFFRRLR